MVKENIEKERVGKERELIKVSALTLLLMEGHFCHCGSLISLRDGDNGCLRERSLKSSPTLQV